MLTPKPTLMHRALVLQIYIDPQADPDDGDAPMKLNLDSVMLDMEGCHGDRVTAIRLLRRALGKLEDSVAWRHLSEITTARRAETQS